MDGSFSINFWRIEWTREFEMKVFTKKAANGHSGKEEIRYYTLDYKLTLMLFKNQKLLINLYLLWPHKQNIQKRSLNL